MSFMTGFVLCESAVKLPMMNANAAVANGTAFNRSMCALMIFFVCLRGRKWMGGWFTWKPSTAAPGEDPINLHYAIG